MKKLLFIFLLLPALVFAQSDAANQQAIDSLKTNTARNNNAKFLWRLYKGLNDSKLNKDSSNLILTTTGTNGAATYTKATRTLNVPNYNAAFPSNANGVLKNNGSGTLSWISNVSTLNGSWQTITLLSPWVNFSGTAQYRVDASGKVHLRGSIYTNGTNLTSPTLDIASGLPHPTVQNNFTILYSVGTTWISVTTSGILHLANGSGSPASSFYLDGISYYTD